MNVLENFYKNNGFINATVTDHQTTRGRWVTVAVAVTEGRRVMIRNVHIAPNPLLNDTLLTFLQTRPGGPLVYSAIADDAQRISDTLSTKGFLTARTIPEISIDSSEFTAIVRFNAQSGPRIIAGPAEIEGVTSVLPGVVRRELAFNQGDTLTSALVRRSIRNLYFTRLFSLVTVSPRAGDSAFQLPPTDSAFPIGIRLSQAQYFSVETNIGYGSEERLRFDVTTSYANLFRRGHGIAFNGNVSSSEQQGKITYSTPWIFMVPLQFSVSPFYTRHDHFLFTDTLAYRGVFTGVTFSVGKTTALPFSYQVHVLWEYILRLSPGDQASTLPEDVPKSNTNSVQLQLTYDKRNDIFNTKKGYFIQALPEIAGILGFNSNQFYKVTVDARGYDTVGHQLYLSSAVLAGYAKAYGGSRVIPPQNIFYGGGSRSVRGYKQDQLIVTDSGGPRGGTVALILHIIDFQFPLFWWFRGALFSDAGYIWNGLPAVRFRDLKFTAGPGLRLATPLGLFRFDVGFQLDRLGEKNGYAFHFDVGKPF